MSNFERFSTDLNRQKFLIFLYFVRQNLLRKRQLLPCLKEFMYVLNSLDNYRSFKTIFQTSSSANFCPSNVCQQANIPSFQDVYNKINTSLDFPKVEPIVPLAIVAYVLPMNACMHPTN